MKDSLARTEVQDETVTVVVDGAYSGKENHDLAAEKNLRLVNTDLSGKFVDDILAEFVFNEEGTKVLRCPAGYEPKSCVYTGGKSQQFHVSFQRDQCANCPNKDRCKAKIHKRVSSVFIAKKISCRQDAGTGIDPWKIFLWLQDWSLKLRKALYIQKGAGTLCPKSSIGITELERTSEYTV